MAFFAWKDLRTGTTPPTLAGIPAGYALAQAVAAAMAAVGWAEILTAGNPTYSPIDSSLRFTQGAIQAWGEILGLLPPPGLFRPVPIPLNPPPARTPFLYRVVTRWKSLRTGEVYEDVQDTRGMCSSPDNCFLYFYFPIAGGVRASRELQIWVFRLLASDSTGAPFDIPVSYYRHSDLHTPLGVKSVEIFPVYNRQVSSEPQRFAYPDRLLLNPSQVPNPVPQTIPLPVNLPPSPDLFPYPSTIPLEIPTPYALPDRPLPLLTPPGADPALPALLPPIFISPGGVQVGSPEPGIPGGPSGAVVFPAQGLGSGTETQTDPETRGRRRIPPLDVLCCDSDSGGEIDYNRIRKIAFEELDKKFPPKRPNRIALLTLPGVGRSGLSAILPEYSKILRVLLRAPEDFPRNKQQFGGVGGMNISYCGWLSFGFDGRPSERIQLNYLDSAWAIPEGARFVTLSATYGCIIESATVSYLVEE